MSVIQAEPFPLEFNAATTALVIGAGITTPPMECFTRALAALGERLQEPSTRGPCRVLA